MEERAVKSIFDEGLKCDSRTPLTSPKNIAREKTAIRTEIDNLLAAIDYAHELVSILESEVDPVSAQVPTGPEDQAERELLGSSSVYRSISSATSKIYTLQNRVLRITNYLEV